MRRAPARTRIRAAAAALALGAMLAACGTNTTVQGGNDALSETTLTVYTDLPIQGLDGTAMQSVANGEALALYNAGGRVRYAHHGRPREFHVSFDLLNDADADDGAWSSSSTGRSAHTASGDLSTVAYIGDFDSGATAISAPLNNENDVLQLALGSPYMGFTQEAAGVLPGDPQTYSPYGQHTFARLVPDFAQEARATVAYMRSLGVRRLYVLDDDADPLDAEIAPLVADAAPSAGIDVVGRHDVSTGTVAAPGPITAGAYAATAAAVAATHPDAVLYGGAANLSAAALWGALSAAAPRAKLFAPSTLAVPGFLDNLDATQRVATYVTSPYLEPDQYPVAARGVLAEYRRRFPGLDPTVYTLYGYEAMEDVLRAIARAGRNAANRKDLTDAFFALGEIHGVIGTYRIRSDGDTTLDAFDGYRVNGGGALVLVRRIS